MESPNLDVQLDRAASLGDPVRRALYRFVATASAPVSREEAAGGVGVARHAAKFHLDRLVQDGLLVFEYKRPDGRAGPGAGRPAKLYRREHDDLDVSLPERRYRLAGELLVESIAGGRELTEVAREAGRAAAGCGGHQSDSTLLDVLEAQGYEPCVDGRDIVLANCPFHALVERDADLVCGMNLAFLEGVVDGLDSPKVTARLDPAEHRCCVRLERARPARRVRPPASAAV